METSRSTFRAFATYRGPATRRASDTTSNTSNYDADTDDDSSCSADAMADVPLTTPPQQQKQTSSSRYETARTTVATARCGVPRVPSSRNSASRNLNTNDDGDDASHPSSRRERLMRLLHKIAHRNSSKTRRPQDLARAMLAQESPLLFHAHLIEVVQALSHHHHQQKEMAKVLDVVASALPTSKTKPPSPSAIRALLALETLTHNCPETFADLFLGHAAIHDALRLMLSAAPGASQAEDEVDLRVEARAIAKRVLDWSEYSRSQGGIMIRKWCKRTDIDAIYQGQLKALHQGQVKAACSLCQMSKWEWLADVEEAAVTIQSHFRAYRVRTQMANRAHYHHLGPYTSRVFPHYRRNAPSLEDHQAKASREVHPLPGYEGRIQRRTTTSSSISTVGESLMAQLPLETVYLEEKTDFVERARQAVRTFVDQGRMGEGSQVATPKQRTTDSDYDSGTEYSAATRVTVKPRSYLRHSRRRKASSFAKVSTPDHIRAIHHHVEKVASPKTIFVRE